MQISMATATDEVLARASRGEASFDELAGALARIEQLTVLLRPGDFRRFLSDLDAAVQAKGVGHVTVHDAEAPRQVGLVTAEGFVPQAFTDDGIAREFAVRTGLIEPDEAMALTTVRPGDLLYECLARGYAGVVLDDGSARQINLHRPTIARLYALMMRTEFAALPTLHVVTHAGKVFYQPNPKRTGLDAFVFDSAEAVAEGLPRLRETGAALDAAAMETLPLLALLLRAGATALIVNPELPTMRHYTREDLVGMAGEPPAAPAAAAPAPVDPALEPRAATDTMARPVGPAVPPPRRDDTAARDAFLALHRRAQERSIPIWEYVEALAFDLDYHVPLHPESVDGRRWPMLWRNPDDEQKTMTLAFSSGANLDALFATRPPAERHHVHVAGIEAMRWAFGAPKEIHDIAVDFYDGSEAWLTFPSRWALTAIYPQVAAFENLAEVARVGLAKIGSLPGARGLKPEVVRALVDGWRELVSLADESGAIATPIAHGGGSYLPAFTDQRQHAAFSAAHRGHPGRPARSGAEPPFGRWLAAAAHCDGVVLDPCGPSPLVLDHTDLLVLSLWTREGAPRPRSAEMVAEVARLRAGGTLPNALAGRIVADWPEWFAGLAWEGEQVHVLQIPFERDACALFTSEATFDAFLTAHRNLRLVDVPQAMQAVRLTHRSHDSVFHFALREFDTAWIDPVAMGGPALHLDRELLAAAAARVEERLAPRIPGFVAER